MPGSVWRVTFCILGYLPESPSLHTGHQIAPTSKERLCLMKYIFHTYFADFWCFWHGNPLGFMYLRLLRFNSQRFCFNNFNNGGQGRGMGEVENVNYQQSPRFPNFRLALLVGISVGPPETFDIILKSWKLSFVARLSLGFFVLIISEF